MLTLLIARENIILLPSGAASWSWMKHITHLTLKLLSQIEITIVDTVDIRDDCRRQINPVLLILTCGLLMPYFWRGSNCQTKYLDWLKDVIYVKLRRRLQAAFECELHFFSSVEQPVILWQKALSDSKYPDDISTCGPRCIGYFECA